MIKPGDIGEGVSQVQKYLSLLGYDLIVDGHYGDKTLRSLKAFQKKYNLSVDGIVGPATLSALQAAQKRTSKELKGDSRNKDYGCLNVNVDYKLPLGQYVKQVLDKDKIYIHYTVSGPDAKSVIRHWNSNAERVSTAFVISGRGDEDGQIYEAFNPDYWGFHLGVKGTNGKLDKHSIGIEICNWGELTKKGDKFYNTYGGLVPLDEVYVLDKEWRGKKYFHSFSEKQLKSLEDLILWVIEEYNIPIQNIDFNRDWAEYNESHIKNKTPGVWTHTNVRRDKKDIYPDDNVFCMLNRIKSKVND